AEGIQELEYLRAKKIAEERYKKLNNSENTKKVEERIQEFSDFEERKDADVRIQDTDNFKEAEVVDRIEELGNMESKKDVKNRIEELGAFDDLKDLENKHGGLPPEGSKYTKEEQMEYQDRAEVAENTNNSAGLKGKCKRVCPNCTCLVAVRKYTCECGYNFKQEKNLRKNKRDAHLLVMGKRASQNRNLWRAFDAVEKQSIKIQGGGYKIVSLYYKECPTRNQKGIISGSWLKEEDANLLVQFFCKVIESSRNRDEEQRQEMQQEEELPLLQNMQDIKQEDLLPQYEDHEEQLPLLQNMLCIKHEDSPPEHMQQEQQQPSSLQNVIYIKQEDSLVQDMQQDPLAQDVKQGEQPPQSHSIPDVKQEALALQSVQQDHIS
ncbi:hypothetical protein OTU49_012603, partial [Cherax quadricarinatus]